MKNKMFLFYFAIACIGTIAIELSNAVFNHTRGLGLIYYFLVWIFYLQFKDMQIKTAAAQNMPLLLNKIIQTNKAEV